MYKTIGVLAHVDAGKTTFCEQLLYHTQAIKKRGRVDHQDAHLDNHAIERARGITIFAEQGRFQYKGHTFNLIDTPGHVDFAPEMERAIHVMDAAIIIVSAVEGIQGHTETVWQLLQQHKIPTFIFINKVDREGADVEKVMKAIRQELSPDAILFTNGIDSTVIEWLAERDEALMELFFNDELTHDQSLSVLRELVQQRKAIVCMPGSALKDEGILEFFNAVDKLTTTHFDNNDTFEATVFKIRHDQQQRLTFMKSTAGILKVRDELTFGESTEKITEIRLYNGTNYTSVQQIEAGDIFAVKGLSTPVIGDVLGNEHEAAFAMLPTLQAKVNYDGPLHVKELTRIFRELEAEEPSLRVLWNEQFQEILVHVMGVIQLEVLIEVLKERFSIDVTFGKPQILYKETIKDSAIGYGHFEPLKHYAEVHIKLEPNPRGKGVTFSNACHADDLTVGHQRLIEQHVFERDHHGLLTGFPITDIHVTLLTGRAHNKHTAGGDFREATLRGLRQGLEQVDNILLEPYYRFKMKASNEHIGRIMSDIQQASGTFEAPILTEQSVTIYGRAPVATFIDYSTQFATFTNGKGALTLQFDGYDVCHNAEVIIEQIAYNKDADPTYTSSSIFCAKGKGYSVPWYESKDAMHCDIE
ncbi:TetM/TetW/TetO/TetS family tetracycline resistance ribosomal protection protein [Solibacillus sp. MA9]|uniref:TetM/TetW/TetO/TetS family tetracycline resistance ribosomal protection protein n=1 Tax=Solibacillus palustris TaxID=2908203 RepID=A0ABS9UCB0_9BACL|nr:TetM/TetW/TetO/TetS family tetracycline resistance ribosomal protection protein [Solibacillus sp. MA9]MCH7321980.1 TetM/TetW/TetO/TetS family tetracycline resistance ribosomal protection protein [Solibacillus sp. MA9]